MDDFGLARNRYDTDEGDTLNADEMALLEGVAMEIIEAIKGGMDPKKALGVALMSVCGIAKNIEGEDGDIRLCLSFLKMQAS